jgi:hypothetical protein
MSHYSEIPIEIKDEQALIQALERLGWGREKLEIHKEAVSLYDWHGELRPQKANIIIRRKYIGGASNDVGFTRTANGYTAIISDFDRDKKGFNESWQGQLKKFYGIEFAKNDVIKRGYTVEEVKTERGIRLIANKPNKQLATNSQWGGR